MTSLAQLDWLICVGYVALVMGLGIWYSRQQKTNDEYFLGGRQMHWIPVGLSLFATTFSSNSFVGLPAEAAYRDYHLLLAIYFIPLVVVPLSCIYFIPFYRKLEITSVYEYLELRFSRPVRLFASLVFMFYTAGWMGNMLVAAGKILQVVLHTSDSQVPWILISLGLFATIYTAMGGVKAVIWTDTLQAFALGGGMLFLLFIALNKIDGGLPAMVASAWLHHKFDMWRIDGGLLQPNLFSACAFGFFVYLGGQVGSYTALQRYVSVPSIADARRALIIKGAFTAVACTLFFFVGTSLFVFYQQSAPEIYEHFAAGRKADQLLPHFVMNHASGFGMLGLLLAGLFAAAMSSMDSGINSMSASLVTDWLGGREVGATLNRAFTILFGLAAISTACLIQLIDMPIFLILMSIAGAFLGVLLGVLLLGMLVRRANTTGAICGFVLGLAGFGLSRYLGLQTWWDGAFSCVFGFVGGLITMYFAPAPEPAQTRKLMLVGPDKL